MVGNLNIVQNTTVLYGLKGYLKIIDKIIKDLNAYNYSFDIKLILTEAISNAFIHGNNKDNTKPIKILYYFDGASIIFEVKDSGIKSLEFGISKTINDADILNEGGRGLFLINSLSDELEYKCNTLIIKKNIA